MGFDLLYLFSMINPAKVLDQLRVSKLVNGTVLLFAILFCGETAFSYFDLCDAETLELTENQEEESKSESEKESLDGDKLVQGLTHFHFIHFRNSSFDFGHLSFSESTCSFVDTPPPKFC